MNISNMAKIGKHIIAIMIIPTLHFTGNCGICNKLVTDEGCTAFGKFYHKECFKCCVCKQKIAGKFFEREGKPYCAKDFAVRILFPTSNLLQSVVALDIHLGT